MKTVAVVAWREIVEHRVFLLAALAALAVTLVVPLFPAFLGWSATDVREVLMWSMALGFTWLSAVFLGASMVTGTVAAGRFGFFLARPAGSAAIWFGKLLGVLAVVLTCQVVVVGPAVMASELKEIDLGLDELVLSGLIVIVPLLLVLLAHAVATVWRGGTAWVVVDVVAFAVAVALGWISIGPLLRVGAEYAAVVVGLLLVGGLAVSTVVAGVVQIVAGRGDGRRQHRVFSSVMWPTLVSASVAAAGFSIWLTHPSAEDLVGFDELAVHPAGEWIAVSGPARGRLDVETGFALDLNGRSSFRLGSGPAWAGGSRTLFSADGRVAAWRVRDGHAWRIRYADLNALQDGAADSPILLESGRRLVLSPAGDRLAAIEGDTLVVSELASGDLAGAARIPDPWFPRDSVAHYFVERDRARVLVLIDIAGDEAPSLKALEFDIADRTLTETGTVADAGYWFAATIDSDRDRLLLRTTSAGGEHTYRYVDGRTLEPVGWSAGRELGSPVRMLADGRLLRRVDEGDASWLERLTPDGEIDARIRLPGTVRSVVIGAEPTTAAVAVAVSDREDSDRERGDWLLRLIDLESGEIRELGHGLPATPFIWDVLHTPLPAGSAAARLFLGEGNSLLLWNPVTGRMEPVVRGRG